MEQSDCLNCFLTKTAGLARCTESADRKKWQHR